MDLDPALDPDPTPDPTPFFIDFKDTKKYIFPHFFFTGTSSSVRKIKFFARICVKILFCRHYFSQLYTFMRKWKDPELSRIQIRTWIRMAQKHADGADSDLVPDPDPQHWWRHL
jgi:hypothetical protein